MDPGGSHVVNAPTIYSVDSSSTLVYVMSMIFCNKLYQKEWKKIPKEAENGQNVKIHCA